MFGPINKLNGEKLRVCKVTYWKVKELLTSEIPLFLKKKTPDVDNYVEILRF